MKQIDHIDYNLSKDILLKNKIKVLIKISIRNIAMKKFIFGIVLCANLIYSQSIDSKQILNIQDSIITANDLIDGNILLKPKSANQIISVGGVNADIAGFSSDAIQIAVDALTLRGGGTVKLYPGIYKIYAPVRLSSNIEFIGSGDSTILKKVDGYHSPLTVDGDYGMLKVTVENSHGFLPGMGIQISDSQFKSDWDVTVAKIISIEGNTLFIDQPTLRDYSCANKAFASNTCSIVEGINVNNVLIANFTVEGNKKTNDLLGNCRGGAIYLSKAEKCLINSVKVNNFNGDAFDWQISKKISAKSCIASNCSGNGFHPGTGSDSTLIENCISDNNNNGIFLCWRVKKGSFVNNTLYNNDHNGISINKKDTDNFFKKNHIYLNGENGVWFSNYGEENNSHRNIFVKNLIEDNGTKGGGCGISINSIIHDITIKDNIIRDNGNGLQKCAILIGNRDKNIQLMHNTMNGHTKGDIIRK